MSESTGQLVEHFFRHEYGNVVAVLSRVFGVAQIELVEDMVQSAMMQAMNSWKQRGVPDQPAAWIHRVARNKILDRLRREKVHQRAVAFSGQSVSATHDLADQWREKELPDSLLRMMFVCCHPSLDLQTRVALTLKILFGFSINEIARGLLMNRESVKKRIQRGKKRLAENNLTMDLPSEDELVERLDSVHSVLYLLFNEGYSVSNGSEPIRDELCEDAARFCHILCEHGLGNEATKALLALMLFHSARLESRVADDGSVVLLPDQDRSKWDKRLIRFGQYWLAQSAGKSVTRFHLEAAIAMTHCMAASVDETDWKSIVALYDRALKLQDSPIYVLNRAIACGQMGDVQEGLRAIATIEEKSELNGYFLVDCGRAKLHELAGEKGEAIDCYLKALSADLADHERELINRRLKALTGN